MSMHIIRYAYVDVYIARYKVASCGLYAWVVLRVNNHREFVIFDKSNQAPPSRQMPDLVFITHVGQKL